MVAKPIRQSLRHWAGSEDIMKVALEMAKHSGEDRVLVQPARYSESPTCQPSSESFALNS